MKIVNGYPCRNCADESLAKRGLDPAKAKPGTVAAAPSRDDMAVRFGGSLAARDADRRVNPSQTVHSGRLVDLRA